MKKLCLRFLGFTLVCVIVMSSLGTMVFAKESSEDIVTKNVEVSENSYTSYFESNKNNNYAKADVKQTLTLPFLINQ